MAIEQNKTDIEQNKESPDSGLDQQVKSITRKFAQSLKAVLGEAKDSAQKKAVLALAGELASSDVLRKAFSPEGELVLKYVTPEVDNLFPDKPLIRQAFQAWLHSYSRLRLPCRDLFIYMAQCGMDSELSMGEILRHMKQSSQSKAMNTLHAYFIEDIRHMPERPFVVVKVQKARHIYYKIKYTGY